MDVVLLHDTGPAVEDVQQRLVALGFLEADDVDGVFEAKTAAALNAFRESQGAPAAENLDQKTWNSLVDATFSLGDRTLYLRMPHFHGNDVAELQGVLGALGFSCGVEDGIFGAHTEDGLRKFQMNLGLPTDGIAGAYTYEAIRNLRHSWMGKEAAHGIAHVGFSRAADVLERNALCLFGTEEFTRGVAARMSNLALATNPASKIVSADSLLTKPGKDMLRVHIMLPQAEGAAAQPKVPLVSYADEDTFALRLRTALRAAERSGGHRIAIELPGPIWEDAGEARSAQHYAITLLDALCTALV